MIAVISKMETAADAGIEPSADPESSVQYMHIAGSIKRQATVWKFRIVQASDLN
jgi:hypothetical protein